MRWLLLLIISIQMMVAVPVVAQEQASGNRVKESLEQLEISEGGFNWRKDWWKYLLIVLGSLLALFFAIRITNMLFRMIVFSSCLAIGGLGSLIFAPYLTPLVERILPENVSEKVRPGIISHAIVFFCAYFIALCLMHLVLKPMRNVKKDTEQ